MSEGRQILPLFPSFDVDAEEVKYEQIEICGQDMTDMVFDDYSQCVSESMVSEIACTTVQSLVKRT